MDDTTTLQFVCDTCGKKHTVEVVSNSEPDDTWPIGWLLLRTRAIGLSADLEKVFCCECRDPVLTVLGYPCYKNYVAVVKAIAEVEQQHAHTPLNHLN